MQATHPRSERPNDQGEMAGVVDRNITALLSRRKAEEKAKGAQEQLADAVTAFTGSMPFVYLHLAVFGTWVVANLGWLPAVPRFDPSLVILAVVASVEAIFLSTFILISQNRMQAIADRRAELNLHVSLLAEHEVTKLVELVTAIADRMNLEQSRNPELQELAKDVQPEKVLDRMAEMEDTIVAPPKKEEPGTQK